MARYIDAEKLCKGLKDMASVQYPDRQKAILGVISTIENTPTADVVEVRHGKDVGDIGESEEWYGAVHICGLCGCNWMIYITQDLHYCPRCGAKMDGGKNENV